MYREGYCPCDLCNGRLTGAREDEEPGEPEQVNLYEYEEDPYKDLCQACGTSLVQEDGSVHTMADCPSPWWWSAYEGTDRDERCREDEERWKRERQFQ